ncbi:MAG: hypothetical protein ACI4J1_10045 [Ruminiclostridium sp.]
MKRAEFFVISGSKANLAEPFLTAMFNPESYSIEDSAEYSTSVDAASKLEFLQFTKLGKRILTMDLYFDTLNGGSDLKGMFSGVSAQLSDIFCKGDDVRNEVEKLHSLMLPETVQGYYEPPTVKFTWGGFQFSGKIISCRVKYDMFLMNGTPVKATASITMWEDLTDGVKPPLQMNNAANAAAASAVGSTEKDNFAEQAQTAIQSVV